MQIQGPNWVKNVYPEKQISAGGKIARAFVFIVLLLGILSVGLSRMIVGVHSLNQIIYGYLIGFWTLAYVLTYWRPVIKHHMTQIQKRALTSS